MSKWFSRINPFTGEVASGNGEIEVDGRPIGMGHMQDWYGGRHVMVKGENDWPTLIDVDTKDRTVIERIGAKQIAAGGGIWSTSEGGVWVSISRQGEIARIVEHGRNEDRSLFIVTPQGAHPIVEHDDIHYCRIENGHVVWARFGRGQRRSVWGCRPGGQPELLQLFTGDELLGVPVWTPSGMWVVIQTHMGFRVAPWEHAAGRDKRGSIIITGNDNNLNPDAMWTPYGLAIACNTHDGRSPFENGRFIVDQSIMDDLMTPAPPIDPPPPPPEKQTMELPREIRETYEKVSMKFPTLLQSTNDDDRRVVNRRAIATIRRRHKGEGPLDGSRYVCKNEHRGEWGVDSKDSQGYVAPEFGRPEHGREMNMFMFDMVDGNKRVVHPHPIKSHNRTDDPPNLKAYVLIPQGEDDKDWLEEDGPIEPPDPVEPGEPQPIARSKKHAWWRGDTENRDDCNHPMTDGTDCDRGKDDPIHDVQEPEPEPEPELQRHAFKGLLARCTFPKCGRAKTDPIHTTVEPDPKPTPTVDYEKKSLENQAEIIRLLKLAVGE